MAELNLLPRKEFEIILDGGQKIRGQFGTWALKRFCDKMGYTIRQADQSFKDPSFSVVVSYISSAVEHVYAKRNESFPFNDIDVCAWIDDLGGWQSDFFVKLFNHSAKEGNQEEEKKTDVS